MSNHNHLFPVRSARVLCVAFFAATAALSAFGADPVKPQDVPAEASRYAIGVEVGTLGYGPAFIVTASKHFTANLNYTWFNYDYDVDNDDGEYKGKLKLSNFQAIANWHPFAGNFHLSAGAFISNNKVSVTAQPKANGTYTIGDVTYTAAQVGTATGTVELTKGVKPYLGLGWSKKPERKGFGCFFDMGVLFMDAPDTKLTATGTKANDPTFQANLRKEEKQTNEELDNFKYYPVIQVGLMYRF